MSPTLHHGDDIQQTSCLTSETAAIQEDRALIHLIRLGTASTELGNTLLVIAMTRLWHGLLPSPVPHDDVNHQKRFCFCADIVCSQK